MFKTSKKEISEMLVSLGEFTIEQDHLHVENYPFQPSVAFTGKKLPANNIIDVDLRAVPPTVRVGDELIFVPADKKERLEAFATANHIPIVERADIWDWLLTPFLDTEYSEQMQTRLFGLLATCGLTEEMVSAIRDEVKTQMFKYNFDTMLWEWQHLGALDVLCAMRTKYNKAQFADFYRRAMEIALLPTE